jgi:DNA-binding NarL/FixJ family response regulator
MRGRHPILDPYVVPIRSVIVDDNSYFLDAARELLEREGIEVAGVASNSADALRLVAELEPDVTLVDVDLGDEDGFELARRLVETDGSNVILVSTHPEVELAELVSASPCLGFIHKTRLSAAAIRELLEPAA